ncbi:MAG: hypothetical protein AAGI17_09815 [Planctomycetota bacterium]
MKPVLNWAKAHWLIVVLGVLTLALPIGGYIGSGIFHEGVVKTVKEEYDAENRKISGAERVSYVVPAITNDGSPIQISRAPNASVTAALSAELKRRTAEIEATIEIAEGFNRRGHDPLVDGLFGFDGVIARSASQQAAPSGGGNFGQPGGDPAGGGQPATPPADPRPKLAEMRDVVVGVNGPSAYQKLFDSINAGPGADNAEIAEAVQRREELERAKIDGDMTPEQETALRETLRAFRVQRYRAAAERASIFGTPESVLTFETLENTEPQFSVIPLDPETARPNPAEAFVWQWDYWIIADLFKAIGNTNRGATGLEPVAGVEGPDGGVLSKGSAVKRLLSIRIQPVPLPAAGSQGAAPSRQQGNPFGGGGGGGGAFGGGGGATGRPRPAAGGAATWSSSHTGRTLVGPAAAQNGAARPFDTRRVRLSAVVASDGIQPLLDELTSVNLNTVVGVQVEAIDPWDDLANGFFYGPESVVVVTIDLETSWLRSWMNPMMPPRVRAAFGAPTPTPPVASSDAPQTP